jgi:hypothetical protein
VLITFNGSGVTPNPRRQSELVKQNVTVKDKNLITQIRGEFSDVSSAEESK